MSTEAVPAGDSLTYSYRPSLVGSPSEFRLTAEGLEWSVGRGSGRVPFGQVRRVRMSYRPANMQTYRFITEVWADGVPKLKVVSTSWKNMMQQERLDKPYSAFVAELHRRLAQAESAAHFEQGKNQFVYWLGFTVFVCINLGLAGLIVRALQADTKSGAAFVGVFLALFLWQGGDFLRRNRPGVYRPDALPTLLMPKA